MKRWPVVLMLVTAVTVQAQLRTDVKVVVIQQVTSVSVSPASVIGGATVIGTVTIAHAAGSSGVPVTFKSSNPSIAAVPASTLVQPGSTSATFVIQTYPVVVNPNVVADPPSSQISAQFGSSTKSAKLSVLPPSFTTLTLDPSSVAGSNPSTGTVSLSGAAPSGGFTIGLNVKNPESAQHPATFQVVRFLAPVATVPSQVVVPAGATSASFPITTRAVSVSASAQINATHGAFVTKSATITVLPPGIASIGFGMGTYQCPASGQSVTGTVTLTAPAPSEGMTVPLSLVAVSSTPGVYCPSLTACGTNPSIPASLQFAAGSTSVSFPVTISAGQGCYELSASGTKALLRVSPPLIPCCQAPKIPFNLPHSVKGGSAIQATLTLDGVASNCPGAGHFKLQSSNTNLAQVPAEVIVPVGSSTAPFTITTSAVPSNQTVDISVRGCYGSCCANVGWRGETVTLTP